MRPWIAALLVYLFVPTAQPVVPSFPMERGKDAPCRPVGGGTATYYGIDDGFAGKLTANGEVYEPNRLTAAHRKLPLGSIVRVRSGERHVFVRINDRGPAKWTGHFIDLLPVAFRQLGELKQGVLPVTVELFRT